MTSIFKNFKNKISAQKPPPLKPKSSPHAQISSYGENVLLAGPGKVIGHFWSKNHENDFREVAWRKSAALRNPLILRNPAYT